MHPSTEDMKLLVDNLLIKVAQATNNPDHFMQDAKSSDTIAIGMTDIQLIISGNVKARRHTESTNPDKFMKLRLDKIKRKAEYIDFGIGKDLSEILLTEITRSVVFHKSRLNVTIVEEKENPKLNSDLNTMQKKANELAAKHAESKI